jgi:N-dimethylarginine dimethylaminohydrolase
VLEPALILIVPEAEQVVIAVPAIAVGSVLMVSVLVEITEQLGFEAVRVIIILPDAISATLGL